MDGPRFHLVGIPSSNNSALTLNLQFQLPLKNKVGFIPVMGMGGLADTSRRCKFDHAVGAVGLLRGQLQSDVVAKNVTGLGCLIRHERWCQPDETRHYQHELTAQAVFIPTMPSKPRNRIGETYGQLTVVRSSERRTKGGNAFWWCRCSCGREREVPGDKLSHNLKRRKAVVTACELCARELQIEGVCSKNDREEAQRRRDAEQRRKSLEGHVPARWLKLPLTDAHARELDRKIYFQGKKCKYGHVAPYRINGGCLACSGQTPPADISQIPNN